MNTNPITNRSEINIKLERTQNLFDQINLDALFLLTSQEVIYGKA
jgi:hypothetical protein